MFDKRLSVPRGNKNTGKDVVTVIKESPFWKKRERIINLRRKAGVHFYYVVLRSMSSCRILMRFISLKVNSPEL
ncbi:hypothetical protein, partial [Dickeya dianthicola]